MYVLVDCDRMAFLYTHANSEVLVNIALIECPRSSAAITPRTKGGFGAFTDLELTLLYKNTTGQALDHVMRVPNRAWLIQVMLDLASKLPVLVAYTNELAAQCEYICGQEHELWRYQRGSMVPLAQEELFEPPALQTPRNAVREAELVASTPVEEVQGEFFAAVGPVGKVARQTVQATQRAAPVPAQPRAAAPPSQPRGGNKTVIWETADAMWAEAGNPTSPPVVLALRKKIMDALEAKGVKRTSSSNELGNWQKFRLNNK